MKEKKKKNKCYCLDIGFCITLFHYDGYHITFSTCRTEDPNANQFNSPEMWLTIGFILLCYILPLIIYMLGVDMIRYVMAILCGL